MVRNDAMPVIEVDPDTYMVRVDGEIATVPPAERLRLPQLRFPGLMVSNDHDRRQCAAISYSIAVGGFFFPSEMYAHSPGLESMVARGWVNGACAVREYLRKVLVWSVLPSGGVALVNASFMLKVLSR